MMTLFSRQLFLSVTDMQRKSLETKPFQDLDVNIIQKLCKRTSFIVKEMSLFYATVLWAGNRCEEEKLDPSPANLRSKMEPFIKHIRFPLMKPTEFRDGPGKTGILTGEECYKILGAICLDSSSEKKSKCGFNGFPRQGASYQNHPAVHSKPGSNLAVNGASYEKRVTQSDLKSEDGVSTSSMSSKVSNMSNNQKTKFDSLRGNVMKRTYTNSNYNKQLN